MKVEPNFRRYLSNRHEIAREWKSRNRPVVGWTCSYTPEEIAYAAGALPVMVWGVSATPDWQMLTCQPIVVLSRVALSTLS